MNNAFDIKNFKKKVQDGKVTLIKQEDGTVKIVKKRVDEDGDPIAPFEMVTTLEHFDNIVLDNRMQILQERQQIALTKTEIAKKEKELDDREKMLDKDAADFRAEIAKFYPAAKK